MESEIFKALTRILKSAELSFLKGGYIYDSKMRPLTSEAIHRARMLLIKEGSLTVYHLNNETGDLVKYSVTPKTHSSDIRPLTASEMSRLHDSTIEVLHPKVFKKKFRRIKWNVDLLFSTVV